MAAHPVALEVEGHEQEARGLDRPDDVVALGQQPVEVAGRDFYARQVPSLVSYPHLSLEAEGPEGILGPLDPAQGSFLGIDPYISISEGTLIATVRPDHTRGFLAALREEGIEAADVGEMTEAERGTFLVVDGEERPLEHPGLDPFWEAFGRWAQEAAQEI